MAGIVLENLEKVYPVSRNEPVLAVRDVNLTITDRELLVLTGPSGCGKTTLLRMIAGLEVVTRGTIRIDGRVMNQIAPQDRDVSMVFQNYALYPHMSVLENLTFGLKLRKVASEETQRRLRTVVELLGIQPYAQRLPKDLSGGERQRVALGRALMRQPRVFLLDEPLANLDTPMRIQMRRELCRLHARLGATMVYVTHDQDEAMTMGHRIAVMKNGQIQQVAEPMTIYHQPTNVFVAGFFGSPPMNFFPGSLRKNEQGAIFSGRASDQNVPIQDVKLPVPPAAASALLCDTTRERSIILGIRPEDIYCATHSLPGETNSAVDAQLDLIENCGAEQMLRFSLGSGSFMVRQSSAPVSLSHPQITVHFNMAKAHWFDAQTGHAEQHGLRPSSPPG